VTDSPKRTRTLTGFFLAPYRGGYLDAPVDLFAEVEQQGGLGRLLSDSNTHMPLPSVVSCPSNGG